MISEARTTRPSARRQAPPHLAGGNTSTERNWGNDNAMSNAGSGRRLFRAIFWSVLIVTTFPLASEAQYKGDDIPGFLGLQSGTQAPPGIYVGNVVWVYPTSTIKDNSGHAINLPGSLTSTAEIILLNVATQLQAVRNERRRECRLSLLQKPDRAEFARCERPRSPTRICFSVLR